MPDSGGHGIKHFVWFCLFSLAAHFGIFTCVYLLNDFDFFPPKPRVLRVDLVSFAPGPAPGQNEPAQAKAKASQPDTDSVNLNSKPLEPVRPAQPVTVLKPDISLKVKPKNIKDLMALRKPKAKPVQKKTSRKLKPKPKKNPKKALEEIILESPQTALDLLKTVSMRLVKERI